MLLQSDEDGVFDMTVRREVDGKAQKVNLEGVTFQIVTQEDGTRLLQYDFYVQGIPRVAVGVSGGKDSIALLSLLASFHEFSAHPFSITAVTLDPGFEGGEGDYSAVADLCASMGIPYLLRRTHIYETVFQDPVPNIFAAYADTAYQIDALGLVADLGQYLTDEEIGEYIPAYIDEGRLRADGKLKIFPTAKSTEIFMLNKTDWDRFSSATGVVPMSMM